MLRRQVTGGIEEGETELEYKEEGETSDGSRRERGSHGSSYRGPETENFSPPASKASVVRGGE